MSGAAKPRYWRKAFDHDTIARPRGSVGIQESRCKGCGYCVEFCPRDVLALSDRFNLKGYHPPEVVIPDGCVACRLCELLCPEFAIGISEVNEREELRDVG